MDQLAERSMRQLNHDQCRNRNENPQPSLDRMEGVSRKMWNSRRNVDERHDTKAGQRY